jgi:microcystin-dependent protein
MAEPFLAEVKIVGFNFAPRGWARCDGQLLPIAQNQSLYSLLGTMYGGDGRTYFGLPDLRGRTPIHVGAGYPQGRKSGTENVPLSVSELPAHRHAYRATCADATSTSPEGAKLAPTAERSYRASGERRALHPAAAANAGGGQGHNNMQPYLTLNFVIALQGVFPPRV